MTPQRRLIFLCGEAEGEAFRAHVGRLAPGLETVWCSTIAALDFATRTGGENARLISFLTDHIVPKKILDRLVPQPLNIHPGPPEYPGAHGLSFAIFENARTYGVTVHEMAAKVDDGPIVMVDRLAMPLDAELVAFGDQVYARAVALADKVIQHCIASDDPIPPAEYEAWSEHHCTRKRLKELMAAANLLTPPDRARLARACGPLLDEHVKAASSHG